MRTGRTIQRRENDLVGASFGRGFYILDDYSILREISDASLQQEAILFTIRDAWWYIPRPHLSFGSGKGSQGDSHFIAPNPDFGAVFTYYLKESSETIKEKRKASEKKIKAGDIPFPGWDALEEETTETLPELIFSIRDSEGNVIRRISAPAKAGIHRVAWDLRYPATEVIRLDTKRVKQQDEPAGFLAAPGDYTVTLYLSAGRETKKLSDSVPFKVKRLYKGSLEGASPKLVSTFWRSYENTSKTASKFNLEMNKCLKRAKAMQVALKRSQIGPGTLDNQLSEVIKDLQKLDSEFRGNPAKSEIGVKGKPTVGGRMFAIYRGIERSTYGPTSSHKEQLQIVDRQLATGQTKLNTAQGQLDVIYEKLKDAGAPYVED